MLPLNFNQIIKQVLFVLVIKTTPQKSKVIITIVL